MSGNDSITIEGGCHCGHVRYTCKAKKEALTKVTKCNCTFCQKLGNSGPPVDQESFKLLSPSSMDEVGNYSSKNPEPNKHGNRYFCQKCGVHVWMEAAYEMGGQVHHLFSISARTITQPQDGIQLENVKMQYFDGLHDNFFAGVQDHPYPGGLI